MNTEELIAEIQKLPLLQRLYVIEQSMRLIRKQQEAWQMQQAAEALCDEYRHNKELTSFTDLDGEDFYETGGNLAD